MMRFLKKLSLFSLALIFFGCASQKSLYYWGSYQPQIYQMYSEPGKAPPEQQLIKFEEDYQKAMSQKKECHRAFMRMSDTCILSLARWIKPIKTSK